MNKKTEPHKKHEQPAKQLLLKSLVLAIKLFVNLLLSDFNPNWYKAAKTINLNQALPASVSHCEDSGC
jgi:hypothetical protein